MTTDLLGGAAALRPGTIVAFRFPLGEGEGRVKTRLCLVIARTLGKDGAPRITIAYGTSAGSQSNRGLDLEVAEPDAYKAAGLRRPTRFVLTRRVTVPASDPGLDRRRAGSPVIGILAPAAMITLRKPTRSLGSIVTADRRRGSIGIRPLAGQNGSRPQRARPGREPMILRAARRRYDRPAAGIGDAPGRSMVPGRVSPAPLRGATGRQTLTLPQRPA